MQKSHNISEYTKTEWRQAIPYPLFAHITAFVFFVCPYNSVCHQYRFQKRVLRRMLSLSLEDVDCYFELTNVSHICLCSSIPLALNNLFVLRLRTNTKTKQNRHLFQIYVTSVCPLTTHIYILLNTSPSNQSVALFQCITEATRIWRRQTMPITWLCV